MLGRRGKHAKEEGKGLARFVFSLAALLVLVQLAMLAEPVRTRLSIVDQLEGKSAEATFSAPPEGSLPEESKK